MAKKRRSITISQKANDKAEKKAEKEGRNFSNWIEQKEEEANEKLIAAAPELLEVLLELRNGDYNLTGAIGRDIEQAIKKATT